MHMSNSRRLVFGINFQSIHPLIATACLFLAPVFMTSSAPAARLNLLDANYISVPLSSGKENKLLSNARASGGNVRMELDTGAPITCVDQSKSTLFGLVSSSTDSAPPIIIMLNGTRHRIAIIPALRFGTVQVRNIPAALIDLRELNGVLRSRHERPDDAILGIDALQAMHAVIDCGSQRLLLRSQPDSGNKLGRMLEAAGWRGIPMHIQDLHLVVSASVNHKQTGLIVDTGSPLSVMDRGLCQYQRIALSEQMFSMKAIHFQASAVKVGKVNDLKIGGVGLGHTLVAVFDVSTFLRSSSTPDVKLPGGLLGSKTLARARAFIDCEHMKLYLKPADNPGSWEF
jgi:predicted aspartyl protease